MERIEYYFKNDSRELKKLSDYIIIKYFGWLPQKDYDDFYSIAGEVLWNCYEKFDSSKGAQFETYLIGCLVRKFKTRVTFMNRQRRNGGGQDVSLDVLIDEKDTALINLIESDSAVEIETYSDKMVNYLKRLSKLQRQVLFAKAEGYSNDEIRRVLKISAKDLSDACTALRSYRNVSVLY